MHPPCNLISYNLLALSNEMNSILEMVSKLTISDAVYSVQSCLNYTNMKTSNTADSLCIEYMERMGILPHIIEAAVRNYVLIARSIPSVSDDDFIYWRGISKLEETKGDDDYMGCTLNVLSEAPFINSPSVEKHFILQCTVRWTMKR